MNHKLLLLSFLLISTGLQANSLQENFEQGLPDQASSIATRVNLVSGSWTMQGVYAYQSSGNTSARMNTGGYLILPYLNNPTSIAFSHKASGSYKTLLLEKSIDKGSTWETLQTYASASGDFARVSATVGQGIADSVLLRLNCKAATIYIDDVEVFYSTMAEEPGQQAAIKAGSISGQTVSILFEKGDGQGRLLVCQPDSSVSWEPKDGVSYTGSFPKRLPEGQILVSSGDEDSVLATGLEPGVNYYFTVFEYNGQGNDRNYLCPGNYCQVRTSEEPSLWADKNQLAFRKVIPGNQRYQSIKIWAKFLVPANDSVLLSCTDPNFSLSRTQNGEFVSALYLPNNNGEISGSEIFVRYAPQNFGLHQAYLSISQGNLRDSILLSGEGSETENYSYYIAPYGSDTNGDGSLENPWYNLQKAVDTVRAGDEIICRGGEYFPDAMKDGSKTTVRISHSGSPGQWISIRNYEGEFPVFNFKEQQPKLEGNRGILLTGNYWHLYGLHITRAGDNGIKLEGSHNIIERCTFSYNFDTGLQLGFGHDFSDSGHGSSNDGSWCAWNDIIDCDSYRNCDYDTNYGSDADGFACKMHNGRGNRFIRCRAWENSDDAWDLYETDYTVVLIECWAWRSGYAEDHTWVKDVVAVSHGFSGNGNAIKMGGNGTGGSSKGKHEAWNCVAFNCNKSGSVKGFDQNSHDDGEKLVNCLAFGCGYDFMFERASANSEYYNNVCLGRQEIAGGQESNNAIGTATDKGWSNKLLTGITYNDFVSLSEEDAKAPRNEDGSLPTRFARLKSSSPLVDAGLYIKNPYEEVFPFLAQAVYGSARDIGPYELEEGNISSAPSLLLTHQPEFNFEVFTGGAGSTQLTIRFVATKSTIACLEIISLEGKRIFIRTIQVVSGGQYSLPVRLGNFKKGVYLCKITLANKSKIQRFIIH
ncbi:MAG: T9SS type A sorting domain-containing protein [Bacteroidales bacterium]|nr:T9SS type A sorting domain-containing protein [Bacteroidales bacterium]